MKVDASQKEVWRRLDRPHGALQPTSVLDGMLKFASTYRGELVTETMLVEGVNDSDDHITETADFLAQLRPAKAYLAIPTRPPAEGWVQAPGEQVVNRAYQILSHRVRQGETLLCTLCRDGRDSPGRADLLRT